MTFLHDGDVNLLVASWTSSRDPDDDVVIAIWSVKVISVNELQKTVH